MEPVKNNIIPAGGPAGYYPGLMLMCAYACQLRCDYCEVRRLPRFMSGTVLSRAIDLLLTTKSPSPLLRFWGGEPLLAWPLIRKGIAEAERKARRSGRSMRFMITTNGLSLDREKINFLKRHNAEVMFSLDGNWKVNRVHRFGPAGRNLYDRTLENLMLLKDSGLAYFVNMVVTPKTAGKLSSSLEFFRGLGIRRVQICYQNGILWPASRSKELLEQLEAFGQKNRDTSFLMNYSNDCEPTMLSRELLADTDGRVYSDAAVFLEKKFPCLRSVLFRGRAGGIKEIDSLVKSRTGLYRILTASLSRKDRTILENNIDLGMRLDSFFSRSHRHFRDSSEHPLLAPVTKGDFSAQQRMLGPLGLHALYLHISGPCMNDCVFCCHKEEGFSDIFKAAFRLRENRRIRAKKLCLVGNEPLLHPEIMEIARLARRSGFQEIEVMTSGELLSDPLFCRELVGEGVTSFSVPLYAGEAGAHDAVTGKRGGFSMVLDGIQNALACRARVFIHTTLVRQNLDHINGLERFVLEDLKLPFVILPVRPKESRLPFSRLMPSYTEIIRKAAHVRSLLGFPLCIVRRLKEKMRRSPDQISDSMKLYLIAQRFYKPGFCRECSLIEKCPGFFREYLSVYPAGELRPVKK